MAKGRHLGEFEQLVLLALLRLGDEAYGMTVRRELEDTAKRTATLGSVYGTLDRLEEKGLVSSWRADPEPVRGGHPRRYFQVTAEGELALRRSQRMMERMWDGVDLSADEESNP
ncbi:PadR family transcriptional regulator [Gemmatimonadota bacterium]